MKKIILIIAIAISVVSCTKQKDELTPAPAKTQATGTLVFYNDTKDTYRVEVWKSNNGGKLANIYTILAGQSMVIANSIAGDYVIGIMKSGTDTSHDYGFNVTLQANCFFEYHIQ